MGSFGLSDGTRKENDAIDRLISKAKAEKLALMKSYSIDRYCEHCETNQGHLSMSHIISVKEAKESGRAEIAYDVDDLELLCTNCHLSVEAHTKEEREEMYFERK